MLSIRAIASYFTKGLRQYALFIAKIYGHRTTGACARVPSQWGEQPPAATSGVTVRSYNKTQSMSYLT